MTSREDTPARLAWLHAALPVILALLFHLPVLFNGLVWDDRSLIHDNPRWGGPASPWELFSRDYGLDLGSQPRGYYRPLFTLTTWALYQIGGTNPFIYHAFSLLLFCLGIFLLTRCFARIFDFPNPWPATLAASFCAVHPMHTEVSSIYASLPDWLCHVAAIALLLAIAPPHPVKTFPIMPFIGSCALASIAGLIKETSFLILGAFALTLGTHALLFGKSNSRNLWPTALGLAIGLALSFSLRIHNHIAPQTSSFFAPFSSSGSARALSACLVSLRCFFLPASTVFIRDLNPEPAAAYSFIYAAILLCGVALWIFLLRRGRLIPGLMLAWLGAGLYNLSLAAASGLPFSERYLSIIPAIYFVFIALQRLVPPSKYLPLAAATLLTYCGLQTSLGIFKCTDSITFFGSLHGERPDEIYGMTGLADALFWDKGDFENATRLANDAIALKPNDPTVRTMGQLLARMDILENRPADALHHLDWAETLQPNYPIIENIRADALSKLGRIDEALAANQRALDLDPENPTYYLQRVRLLLARPEVSDDAILDLLAAARRLGATLPDDLNTREKLALARKGLR